MLAAVPANAPKLGGLAQLGHGVGDGIPRKAPPVAAIAAMAHQLAFTKAGAVVAGLAVKPPPPVPQLSMGTGVLAVAGQRVGQVAAVLPVKAPPPVQFMPAGAAGPCATGANVVLGGGLAGAGPLPPAVPAAGYGPPLQAPPPLLPIGVAAAGAGRHVSFAGVAGVGPAAGIGPQFKVPPVKTPPLVAAAGVAAGMCKPPAVPPPPLPPPAAGAAGAGDAADSGDVGGPWLVEEARVVDGAWLVASRREQELAAASSAAADYVDGPEVNTRQVEREAALRRANKQPAGGGTKGRSAAVIVGWFCGVS